MIATSTGPISANNFANNSASAAQHRRFREGLLLGQHHFERRNGSDCLRQLRIRQNVYLQADSSAT